MKIKNLKTSGSTSDGGDAGEGDGGSGDGEDNIYIWDGGDI